MKRLICALLAVILAAGCFTGAFSEEDSSLTYFDSMIMTLFRYSTQNLTASSDTRALGAALLLSDFLLQQKEFAFDLDQAIYLAQYGKVLIAGISDGEKYVLIYYTDDPLEIAYEYNETTPSIMKVTLDMVFDQVWVIPKSEFIEGLMTFKELLESAIGK